MKDCWEEKYIGEDILMYIVKMREKLRTMTKLGHQNLGKAQEKQEQWYNKKARSRELREGQQVLVLLPPSQKMLHAAWQGSYKVTRKVVTVDYEEDMHDKKKQKRIFHINMWKPWYTPGGVTYAMIAASDKEECGGNDIQQPFEEWSTPHTSPEKNEKSLEEYNDVLNSIPGRIKLVKHKIDVRHAKPIR